MIAREEKEGLWCVLAFGSDWREALDAARGAGDLPEGMEFESLPNPLPTGDHWKPLLWAKSARDKGVATTARLKGHKRDFARKAGEILKGEDRGFCMEIASVVARRFRDDNGLRMERGHVYLFTGPVE